MRNYSYTNIMFKCLRTHTSISYILYDETGEHQFIHRPLLLQCRICFLAQGFSCGPPATAAASPSSKPTQAAKNAIPFVLLPNKQFLESILPRPTSSLTSNCIHPHFLPYGSSPPSAFLMMPAPSPPPSSSWRQHCPGS